VVLTAGTIVLVTVKVGVFVAVEVPVLVGELVKAAVWVIVLVFVKVLVIGTGVLVAVLEEPDEVGLLLEPQAAASKAASPKTAANKEPIFPFVVTIADPLKKNKSLREILVIE
jgi:hypothetical protein